MAKRKAAEREEEQAAIPGLSDIYSAEDLNPALAALQTELGYSGDMMAKVFVTLQEQDGKEARIWNGTPDEYDIEALAKKFGSGDYRVKIMVKMPNGPFVVRGNGVIRMKLAADDDARLKLLRENPQAMSLHAMPQQPAVTPEAIAAAIRAALPPPAPSVDFPAMLATVAGMVKTFMPQPVTATAPQINPVDVLKLVVGAVQDARRERTLNDDDETPRRGGSNQYDLWGKLIDKFTPLFQHAMQLPGAVPAPEIVGAVPAEIAQPGVVNVVEESAEIRQLKQGLSFIVSAADGGHDPELYAELVVNQVPEESLRGLLAMPDPVGYLASLEPRIAGFSEWFKTMLAEVKTILDAPEEPDESTS